MLDTALLKDISLIVVNVPAAVWLLIIFNTSYPPKLGTLPLAWRNILFTVLAGISLLLAGSITHWDSIIRYWRAGTSLLMFFTGLVLVAGRVFEVPDKKVFGLLRYSPNLIGWLFIISVLTIWARGI